MKIRIQGQSIRFRLSKTDISNLEKAGFLSQSTSFPHTELLIYEIGIENRNDLQLSFTNNKITLKMPEELAKNWINTEEVGFDKQIKYGDNQSIYLLVEKDFQCLVPRAHENESDNYKNPLAN